MSEKKTYRVTFVYRSTPTVSDVGKVSTDDAHAILRAFVDGKESFTIGTPRGIQVVRLTECASVSIMED